MKHCAVILAVVLSIFSGSFSAREPDYLVRVDRVSVANRSALLDKGYEVVMELAPCLLVQCSRDDIARLESEGFKTTILDSAPALWDYYQVGLREDSDRALIGRVGTVIHTEENWVLLRVVPGADLRRLYDAKVFVAKVPHERIHKPSLGRAEPSLLSRPPGPENVVPLVQQMVNSVVNADIMNYWTSVVPPNPPGTGTRYSTSTGCTSAAANIYDIYDGLGLAPQYQSYMSGYAPNTIGTITGAVNPGKVYVLIGHLDDMPSSGYAPGADDNASGVVAGLETAKIMSCYAFKNTVKFIACTGEEEGLYGSTAYANDANARGENIQGVIAFDMPGWAGDGTPVPEDLDLNYNASIPGSQALGQLFAACATDYGTGLVVNAFDCPSLNASDHYPFWQKGWAAVCGITDNEGYCGHNGSYAYYHTSNDTIANCGNPAFFYAGVRGTLATLAELAEPFKIMLDKSSYGCSVPVTIIVGDKDLNTDSTTTQTASVQIWSTRESAPEDVILTEQGTNSMIFKGSISLTGAAPVHGDGLLSVNPGDTLSAAYVDAVDCNGATNVSYTASGTVSTDCAGPVITNVQVTGLADSSATVTWTTDEAANSRVVYGTAKPPVTNKDDLATYAASHSVTLTGLSPCTTYYFSVYSEDAVGNPTANDNGGLYYSFTTYGRTFLFGPDNVEGGTNGWTATGTTGSVWHIDTCRSNTATHAWKAGASDVPTCTAQYGNSVTTDLVSGTFALGATGHGYHLRWNEWYATESGYDYCQPQISTDGGTSWTNLVTQYSGSSGGWVAKDVDLAAYTGNTVKVRFHFTSDGGVVGEGWYVDDIEVSKPQACGPSLSHQGHSFTDACSGTGTGGGDGVIDPGEDVVLQVTLFNGGSSGTTGVSGTISSSTTGVTVTDNYAAFPDIAAGATGASQANHFSFRVDPSVACGTTLNFSIHMVSSEKPLGWDDSFSLTVGSVTPGSSTPINESFATGDPPAGWTRVNGGTGTQQWTTTNPGGRSTPAGMTAPFEIIDSDYDGSTSTQDDSLITPAFDCTGATAVTLTFDTYYYAYSNSTADVDVSKDNGSTWTNVTHWTTASVGSSTTASHQSVSITTQAGGMSQVKVRFHYTGNYSWYWVVDNVKIDITAPGGCAVHACAPASPPGEVAPGDTLSTSQGWTGKTTHTWPAVAGASGYKVYRGLLADLPNLLNSNSDSCTKYESTGTSCTASEDPSGVAGNFYWYIVTGTNGGGEGTAGNATAQARIVNSSGACQ